MRIKVEKLFDVPATEIKILVRDDYIETCTPDPFNHLIKAISQEDRIGLITDAVHTFMGVNPPKNNSPRAGYTAGLVRTVFVS